MKTWGLELAWQPLMNQNLGAFGSCMERFFTMIRSLETQTQEKGFQFDEYDDSNSLIENFNNSSLSDILLQLVQTSHGEVSCQCFSCKSGFSA